MTDIQQIAKMARESIENEYKANVKLQRVIDKLETMTLLADDETKKKLQAIINFAYDS